MDKLNTDNPDNSPAAKPRPSRRQRFLFILAALFTLIVLFYAEENWRGKRAWDNYQRERIASGDHFDISWYVLKPVPADQNFYQTPLLRAIGYGRGMSPKGDATAEVAKRLQPLAIFGFTIGTFQEGKKTDLKLAQDTIRSNRDFVLPPRPQEPAADVVAVLGQSAELNELRQASKRPFSQCDGYTNISSEVIPNFVHLRNFAQEFTVSVIAHLALNQSAQAREDAHVVEQLMNALHGNQTLVSAMIRVAISALNVQCFWEGWTQDKWTDEQLLEFQNFFQSANLVADVDRSFESYEPYFVDLACEKPRGELIKEFADDEHKRMVAFAFRTMPRGWIYLNLIEYHQMLRKMTAHCLDPDARRVFPAKINAGAEELNRFMSHQTPFRLLASLSIPNFLMASKRLAQNQAYLDEAALVCALERFRHANGHYPAALDELSPKFMAVLPRDVVGGEQYHYRIQERGFLLYSVGWDEKDNGGKPAKDDVGDWVWPSSAKAD